MFQCVGKVVQLRIARTKENVCDQFFQLNLKNGRETLIDPADVCDNVEVAEVLAEGDEEVDLLPRHPRLPQLWQQVGYRRVDRGEDDVRAGRASQRIDILRQL